MDGSVMAELRRRYAEPHRTFHDWSRVADLLAQAEAIANGIAERGPFILAILFHKAVFDRSLAGCPERSAALMRALLGVTAPEPALARAEALILALARQDVPGTRDPSLRGDAALLLDMDNAVLGADPAAFQAYEDAYRREYAHMGDDPYAAGRAAALRMLLWRDRIYRTDRYYLERERRARRNVEALVDRLSN